MYILRYIVPVILLLIASPLLASDLWKQLVHSSELDFAQWLQSRVDIRAKALAAVQEVQMIAMEDGTRLRTSIYRPNSSGLYPTILVRTPYNRLIGGQDQFGYRGIADYYNPKGYAVIIQTIRGKFESEGTYKLLSAGEIDDGFATVEWISQQSWSNGKVATLGVSHDGFTALAAGIRRPSALKVVIAGGAPGDFRTDAFFTNGTMSTSLLDYIAFIEKDLGPVYDPLFYDNYLSKLLHEPRLKQHDNIVEQVQLRLWDELIPKLNKPSSVYWKQRRIRDRLTQIQVPVVHIAGLFGDGDMPDTVKNYLAMTADPEIANQQRLILGWWPHEGSGPYGDASNVTPYLLNRINAYLDFYLQDKPSSLLEEKRVQMFSKGQEKWITSTDYPVAKTKSTELFLSPNGKLSKTTGASSGSDSYLCDPEVVPTIITDPVVDDGPDQLVYLSDPLTKSLNLLGDANLRLFVSSDTKDADFLFFLFKRTSSGQDEVLSSLFGAVQARYRNGSYNKPVLLNPGEIYELNLPITAVSEGVKNGERIGIVILSNLNPAVVRNANTGKKIGKDKSFQKANIRIYRGGDSASVLTLTVR